MGLISHEQSHRVDIEKSGNIGFYWTYINEGTFKKYREIGTEQKAYRIGSDDGKED